jgi:hypothetical protein
MNPFYSEYYHKIMFIPNDNVFLLWYGSELQDVFVIKGLTKIYTCLFFIFFFLLAIALSVLLRITDYDYPSRIFKLFLHSSVWSIRLFWLSIHSRIVLYKWTFIHYSVFDRSVPPKEVVLCCEMSSVWSIRYHFLVQLIDPSGF